MSTAETPNLSLAEIQRLMGSIITLPLNSRQRTAKSLPDGRSVKSVAALVMKPNERLSGLERIEIYNRQYWFRLVDCLYDDFPGLRAILGERRFYTLVLAYLSKYPSTSFSLRDLGAHLPTFLIESPAFAGNRSVAALDMARFEWAQIEAFDGVGYRPITPDELRGRAAESLTLHLQPYVQLLELNYPFDDFVLALRTEETEHSEASSEREMSPQENSRAPLPKRVKTFLAVHRFENSLYYKRLEKAEFILLKALQEGTPLTIACEGALPHLPSSIRRSPEKIGEKVQGWFSNWAELGWFCVPDESTNHSGE